jgi:hypothetical protein
MKGTNRERRKTKKAGKQNTFLLSSQSMLIHSVVYTGIWLSATPLGQAAVEIRHRIINGKPCNASMSCRVGDDVLVLWRSCRKRDLSELKDA